MSTITKSGSMQILSKLTVIILCAACLQFLCSCASNSGEGGVVDHAIKYANSRIELDTAMSSVIRQLPDAKVDVSLMSVEDTPKGLREIKLEPAIISHTMASWGADEWAANRDDLFFNLAAHFNVICKQGNEYGDIPANYVLACPDYMVVYDSQKSSGFVVTSTGVYKKTDDPDNPIGEAIVITSEA